MTDSSEHAPQIRGQMAAAAMGVAIVVLVVLAAVTARDAGAADINVEGLTGPEVVQKLDLKPITLPSSGCGFMAGPGGDTAYCLDDLQVDEAQREHIAAQIMGFEDNDVLHAYVDKLVEINRLKSQVADAADPELMARQAELLTLWSQMAKVRASAGK